jgi:class 3 adenylate cyclase
MTLQPAGPSRREGTFLLADISGYTSFLHGVADAHRAIVIEADEPPPAYALLSSLLDAMVTTVAPRFRLVKLEGDALFAVADDLQGLRGPAILDCVRACHAEFTRLLAGAHDQWTCSCDACSRIDDLGLKFVLHHGEYVLQRIVGREELAGPDVIVVHRLLKNHARDLVGERPYALFSGAAVAALEVPTAGMETGVETYDDMPPVPVHVLPL